MLAGIDFNDERKLGDARNRDVVLGKLVLHFSKIGLKNSNWERGRTARQTVLLYRRTWERIEKGDTTPDPKLRDKDG